jgi:hypothetical protein
VVVWDVSSVVESLDELGVVVLVTGGTVTVATGLAVLDA